jgi:hypothetical protein
MNYCEEKGRQLPSELCRAAEACYGLTDDPRQVISSGKRLACPNG